MVEFVSHMINDLLHLKADFSSQHHLEEFEKSINNHKFQGLHLW